MKWHLRGLGCHIRNNVLNSTCDDRTKKKKTTKSRKTKKLRSRFYPSIDALFLNVNNQRLLVQFSIANPEFVESTSNQAPQQWINPLKAQVRTSSLFLLGAVSIATTERRLNVCSVWRQTWDPFLASARSIAIDCIGTCTKQRQRVVSQPSSQRRLWRLCLPIGQPPTSAILQSTPIQLMTCTYSKLTCFWNGINPDLGLKELRIILPISTRWMRLRRPGWLLIGITMITCLDSTWCLELPTRQCLIPDQQHQGLFDSEATRIAFSFASGFQYRLTYWLCFWIRFYLNKS